MGIEKGDMVEVAYSDFSVEIVKGILIKGQENIRRGEWKVLATGYVLPTVRIKGHRVENNTIISSMKYNRIVFIRAGFLMKVERCPRCGSIIQERVE